MKANQIEKLCGEAQQHGRHLDGLLIHTMTIILTVGAVDAVINEGWDRVTLDPKVLGVAAVALLLILITPSTVLISQHYLMPGLDAKGRRKKLLKRCLSHSAKENRRRAVLLAAMWFALIFTVVFVLVSLVDDDSTFGTYQLASLAIAYTTIILSLIRLRPRLRSEETREIRQLLRDGELVDIAGYRPWDKRKSRVIQAIRRLIC